MKIPPAQPQLDVVAGILWQNGRYLAVERPPGKILAGFWEFPGGKAHPGETLENALVRELREELGVTPRDFAFWREKSVVSAGRPLTLHFFHVRSFSGTPTPKENQTLRWADPGEMNPDLFLEADRDVVLALRRPPEAKGAAPLGRNHHAPIAAVLLIDLQRDFLDSGNGRMPVDRPGAEAVVRAANGVLSGRVLAGALPVLVLSEFPRDAFIANFFRKNAAVAGSAGAMLDPRIENAGTARGFTKAAPSAFSNPELEKYLRAEGVNELHVLGVFAEGCVRATVAEAVKLGFAVDVHAEAVASDRRWKKRFALWAMRRAGAEIFDSMLAD